MGEQVFVTYYMTFWLNINYHIGFSIWIENITKHSFCGIVECDRGFCKHREIQLIFACVMHLLTGARGLLIWALVVCWFGCQFAGGQEPGILQHLPAWVGCVAHSGCARKSGLCLVKLVQRYEYRYLQTDKWPPVFYILWIYVFIVKIITASVICVFHWLFCPLMTKFWLLSARHSLGGIFSNVLI